MRNHTPVYHYGNTIRFEAEFFDFDDTPLVPEMVLFKIYDYKYKEIKSVTGVQVVDGDGNEIAGRYYYDYTTEPKEQRLFYEWYAEFDGSPSLKRGEILTRFID